MLSSAAGGSVQRWRRPTMADVSADVSLSEVGERGEASQMHRVIDWKHGFYIATGVPALVLVSIGFIATIVGPPSVLVWVLSVVIGMLMSFVFAEIASMFPEKTGGIPIFASVAYRKYTPLVGPVVTWGYWFAWSPVLAINGLLVGGYVNALAIHSTNAWINWLIGAVVLVAFFAINHYGIKQGAYAQLVLGICAILPLLLLGIVPWFHGQVDFARFSPFAPLGGGWGSFQGWVNVFGALFVAGWSAYAFETAVAYCAELFNLALMAFAVWASNGTVGVGASVFVLAASTVGYMTALALVLFGAYLLRRDHPQAERPYRAPRGFIGLGLFLAVLNILFMVAGWWVWGWQSIVIGALIVLASIPIYYYRKLVDDRRAAPAVGEPRLS